MDWICKFGEHYVNVPNRERNGNADNGKQKAQEGSLGAKSGIFPRWERGGGVINRSQQNSADVKTI